MLYHQEHGACGTYMQEHDACGIGSIVNIDGRKDHKVLDDALHIVEKLEHRAGKDATGEVGDGVGILTQISHKFFAKYFAEEAAKEASKETLKAGITQLTHSEEGDYGIGMFFREFAEAVLRKLDYDIGEEFMRDRPDEYSEEDLTFRWSDEDYREFLEELKPYTGEA